MEILRHTGIRAQESGHRNQGTGIRIHKKGDSEQETGYRIQCVNLNDAKDLIPINSFRRPLEGPLGNPEAPRSQIH
jgi:hypothetical protein